MKTRILLTLLLGCTLLTACASATETPPTPTQAVPAIPTSISANTLVPLTPTIPVAANPAVTNTPAPGPSNICTDPQVTALIDSLKTSMLNSDGALLASLVSPASGMDVRYIRYGTVVNYQPSQAKFLFETTYEVDWGAQPGSGEPKVGAFHDVIVPELIEVFNQPYTLHCNELKYGGASYDVSWPYDKDFYSIYFPGTTANGNLDWHTWVAGIEYVNGKPYLYALTQFFWEP
jgi:hypothetical protein